MDCIFFWAKFGNAFAYFVIPNSLARWRSHSVYFDCKTKLCLIGPGKQGKYIFTQENFYVQRKLNDINEQDTSFLDSKHKHMMKNGAPPDNVGVLYRLLAIELHGFTSRINCLGLSF